MKTAGDADVGRIVIMGRKPKSVRSYKKTVWDEFSQYIRLRDCLKTTGTREWGKCITCDKTIHFKDAHAGHFVGGRRPNNLFDETGCHLQCNYCNTFLSANQLVYRRKIIEMYGEGYEEILEEKDKITKHFTIPDLQEIMKETKRKIWELNNLNLIVPNKRKKEDGK